MSGITLYCFLSQALKQGLSMKPRVCQLFSFTDLLDPGIPCLCLSNPPSGYLGLENLNSGLCACHPSSLRLN